MKRCSTCKVYLSKDSFHKNKSSKDGLQNCCIKCHTNKYVLPYHRMKKYKIDSNTYENMINKTNNTCCICGAKGEDERRSLHIDHCHKTGKIRGLLCESCNLGLGKFKDSEELLKKAIEYLKT